MPSKTVDLFEMWLDGRFSGRLASRENGIPYPTLCEIKNGNRVASPQQVALLSKWSKRTRAEVAAALAKVVRAAIEDMVEAAL